MPEPGTYEARFGPVSRRLRRAARAVAWHVKGALGVPRSILVEMRWRLGDEIMALPIYDALKAQYPGATVTVWCTYPELVRGVAVNEDVRPDRYIFLRHAARDENRIEHYARIAGVPVPSHKPFVAAEPVDSDWAAPAGRRVALAPGASWLTKRWPAESWRVLGERLTEFGLDVVVLGNAGESVGAGRDLTGNTTVRDCARILAGADTCVSSDSGLMHLALAVGTPVVALFGPTNPAMVVRDDSRLAIVTNGRECRFCWNNSQEMQEPGVCPRAIADCLGTIDVDTVLKEIQNALATS